MNDCIFCKIVNGDIPSYKVYEDDEVYAFLDINPLSRGHVLVLPKEHYENIFDVPKNLYGHMFKVVKKISERIRDEYDPKGIFINQNNGSMAGQSVFHVHVHIKPIYNESQKHKEEGSRMKVSDDEIKKVLEDLRIF